MDASTDLRSGRINRLSLIQVATQLPGLPGRPPIAGPCGGAEGLLSFERGMPEMCSGALGHGTITEGRLGGKGVSVGVS